MAQKKGLGERIYRSLFGYSDIDEEDLYYEAGELEEEEHKLLAAVEGTRKA
jgi:protoheme IX farnesyltransferase